MTWFIWGCIIIAFLRGGLMTAVIVAIGLFGGRAIMGWQNRGCGCASSNYIGYTQYRGE